MSAALVSEFESMPEATTLTADEAIAAIDAVREPGVTYRFSLYRPLECQKCGEPGNPIMRFARSIPSEAWIMGEPVTADGERDRSKKRLVCALLVVDPVFDPKVAETFVAQLESLAAELNA